MPKQRSNPWSPTFQAGSFNHCNMPRPLILFCTCRYLLRLWIHYDFKILPIIVAVGTHLVELHSKDKTRQDKTRQDKTRQNKTRQDKTRQDKTRQDKTRQDKTRQDKIKTRQDKTRQDKTRQDKTRQWWSIVCDSGSTIIKSINQSINQSTKLL